MSAMVGTWVCTSMVTRARCVPCYESLPRSVFALTLQRRGVSRHRCPTTRRGVTTGALSANPSGGEPGSGLGSTRLGRLISVRRRELQQRWNTVRRRFPAKVFLLLFGFFSANALATILGQTGDWDVIAAGILVALIEGLGHLMYRRLPGSLLGGARGKAAVELVNYWKIGFTFALFVDAFKVGS